MAISQMIENEQVIFSMNQSDINQRIMQLESVQNKAPKLHLEVLYSLG
jgi:hypothetical protein